MSTCHGGFVLARPPAAVFESVRRAVRDYMFREVPGAHAHHIAVVRLPATELVHVSVRGPAADGHDLASFHVRHVALAGLIARALRVRVHAITFEDRSGSESVTSFGPDGREERSSVASWDEVYDRLVPSFATDDGVDAAWASALPLSKLADSLFVPRGTLTEDPRGYEAFEIALVGDVPVAPLRDYLATG